MTSDGAPSEGTAPVASRWRARAALAGGVIFAFVLLARAVLPYAIERAVPRVARDFGFAASVANVDLGLLAGHVTVDELRIAPAAEADGVARDLISLGSAFANVEWLSLLRGEIDVAELRLEKPVLALVRRPDGILALPALPPPSEPEPPSEPDAKGEPLPVVLRSLSIRDTEFHLIDGAGGPDLVDFALAELGFDDLRLAGSSIGLGGIRISEPRLRVRREVRNTRTGAPATAPAESTPSGGPPPDLRIERLDIERAEFSVLADDGEPVQVALHLRTSGVSLAPDATFPLDFGLTAGEGTVALEGRLGLNPLVWDGRVEWRGLAVPLFVRAAAPELIPWIRSCRASGDLAVVLSPSDLRANGRWGIDELALEDPEGELAFGWKSLAVDLRELRIPLVEPQPIELAVSKISLDEPRARYVLPNTAIERLSGPSGEAPGETAAPPEEPAAPADPAPAPPPRISIDAIEVRGGRAEFVDRTGPQPYQGRISQLTVDAAGVQLPERTVRSAHVRGLASERAPFDLRAELPGARGTVRFTLDRLPLAQFTPYSARAADLRIPKGTLSIKTQVELAQSGAAGRIESRVVAHDLAVRGGANAIAVAGMPIDAVLALLRDPHGDIALAVPLVYGEHGASAGVGAILLGALQTAITGAVTAPIKALGAVVPEGNAANVAFAPVGFAPGDAAVGPDGAAPLGALADLLEQRPGIALTLSGRAGPDDRASLAERLLVERVASDRDLPDVSAAGFLAGRRVRSALAERGRGESGALEPKDEPLLRRYVEATEVPAERFADLARRRAEQVREAIVSAHGIAPDRLHVEVDPEPGPSEVAIALRSSPSS